MQDYKNFEVDSQRGFLPQQDPLATLPAKFSPWEEVAASLPKLLVTDQTRKIIAALPQLNIADLSSTLELERAMMLLSYVGHAYVWAEMANTPKLLPQTIAVPWHETSAKLGRLPVLSYASYALYNWRRIDQSRPVELGNIALLQNFLGGIDEEWFILIHIDIEAKAAAAVTRIFSTQQAAKQQDSALCLSQLKEIATALKKINSIMSRMTENCDPYIYYNRVRPYIHGWQDNPALPDGLLYEGVSAYGNKPQKFRGETGAQSSIIPAIDALLGVKQKEDPLSKHLENMRNYMPPRHRAFIEAIEQAGSIRSFVIAQKDSDPALRSAYNSCVTEIEKFRNTHLKYAADYIDRQKQTTLANPSKVGTGGTPFMNYLTKHRDGTGEFLI